MRTDVDTKHRKKRPTKKPYAIEWRCSLHHDWSTFKRYPTEEQRDKALACLQQKDSYIFIEYRIKP